MKDVNEEYYSYKSSVYKYKALYDSNIIFIELLENDELLNKKKRIKWLCKYELEILKDLLKKLYRCRKRYEENKEIIEGLIKEILELLK